MSNYRMLRAANFDVCVLATSDRSFGYRREIHVWITPADFAGTEGRANVLFVSSTHEIELSDEEEDQEGADRESEAGTEGTTSAEEEQTEAEAGIDEAETDADEIKVTDSLPDAAELDGVEPDTTKR